MSTFRGVLGVKLFLAGAVALAVVGGAGSAHAEVKHVVAKGHTLAAIAHRYHVTPKAIMEANDLKSAKRLRVGDVLTIPTAGDGTKASEKHAGKGAHDKAGQAAKSADPKATDKKDKGRGEKDKKDKSYKAKPKTPWLVHLRRAGTSEDADVRVRDARGKVPATALRAFEKTLRSGGGATHPIEGRLLTLLGIVSNHFGGRRIEVVSGFRPFTPTQYNPHSNHNHGRAIDFRVVGVPNEVVRDFCRTLKNTGCGYYPNSTFVHMDTREKAAFWVDYSKPGEAPRYNAPGLEADEGTSDVHQDAGDRTGETKSDATPAPAGEAKSDDATNKGAETKPEASDSAKTPEASEKKSD